MTPWIEAMRLRTLPVSCAGVVMGCAYALRAGCFKAIPALLCLLFAILAQIASNFANEYYDYRAGLDRAGREGPRRGVTEGDITPGAMRAATYGTLALAAIVGCGLIPYGGWWLVAAGAVIALGALSYSTGPWPLSRHALGEVAVLIFFGLVPVCLTYYVQGGAWGADVTCGGAAVGLMGANVLIVNNYRDYDDDRAVGKKTLAGVLGLRMTRIIYLLSGLVAVELLLPLWGSGFGLLIGGVYLVMHIMLSIRLGCRTGAALTPVLAMTAMLMLAVAAATAIFCLFV